MNIKKLILTHILVLFGLLSACVFGVTVKEIEIMKSAMPDKPVVQPAQERTILVFSLCNGFRHSSVSYWDKALDIMSEKTGAFKVVHSEDMSVFSSESLKQFDAICFNNTTKLTPDASQQQAILDFIKSGKGIAGIHAATDNFYEWPEGMQMMGGVFEGHPWNANGTWAVKLDDPDHPLMKSFAGNNFKINDEIYRTASPVYSRKNQRVLMSLDMSDSTTRNANGVVPDDMDTGISWVKRVGEGRLFYCSLGHNHHITWNTPVLEHFLAGFQYALGDFKIDDSVPEDSAMSVPMGKLNSLIEDLKGYDWADSRTSLVDLDNLIKVYYSEPRSLQKIEVKLVDMLDSDVSLAAKDFVCRQLAVIGTEAPVTVLLSMLDDPETQNLARLALEKNPSPKVDQELLKKLNVVKDTNTQIGIINTLGVRRYNMAANTLSGLAHGTDKNIAVAAIQALGVIGTQDSADYLGGLTLEDSALRMRILDARLTCAQILARSGQTRDAEVRYKELYSKDYPSLIQSAALIGLVETGSGDASRFITQAIMGTDTLLQSTALKSVADIKDISLLNSIASKLKTLPENAQIPLMISLAANENSVGCQEVEQLLSKTKNQEVRLAAYHALSFIGDASTSQLLARYAADVSDRDERKQAQEALYRLSGDDVDPFILKAISNPGTDEEVAVELIKATVQRPIYSATPVLLQAARDESRAIASESMKALQSLATPDFMKEVIDLLVEKPDSAMENVVLAVAGRIEDRHKRAEAVLAKYPSVQAEEAKVSMLSVMGKLGDKNSVALLKKEYVSKNPTLQQAAFRAMTDWPGGEFMTEMKTLAQSGKDAKTKILAFRAYVKAIQAYYAKEDAQQAVDALIKAYAMAERADEKKIVISVLGSYNAIDTMNFLSDRLEDAASRAEAEVSLMKVCAGLLVQQPREVRAVLKGVSSTTESESVRKQAGDLLAQLVGLAEQVVHWQVSGPYASNGAAGKALFNHVFDPEENISEGQWTNAAKLVDKDGILNLRELSGDSQRVAYLKTTVTVEKATDALLGIGSDDAVKVWVNGSLVHANNAARPVKKGQDKVKVSLKKGANQFLVKVVQYSGDWAFCMSITDTNSEEIPGLQIDSGN